MEASHLRLSAGVRQEGTARRSAHESGSRFRALARPAGARQNPPDPPGVSAASPEPLLYARPDSQHGRPRPVPRRRRHPLRRRLRRRDAAHGHAVHARHGARAQRPRHAARLPGRDPRARRHHVRRERLPAPVRLRHRAHARRRGGPLGSHEPGRAQGPPAPRARRRRRARRPRRVRQARAPARGVRRESARHAGAVRLRAV